MMVGKSRRRGGKSKKGVSQKEGFKIPKEPSEELLDNERHARGMSLLYMIQQRQETALRLLDKGDYELNEMQGEVTKISEALLRIASVFNLTKDQLNSTQIHSSREYVVRRQLQINTRITKCTALQKVQNDLEHRVLAMTLTQNSSTQQINATFQSQSFNTSIESVESILEMNWGALTTNHHNGSIPQHNCGEGQDYNDTSLVQSPPRKVPFASPYYSQRNNPEPRSQLSRTLGEMESAVETSSTNSSLPPSTTIVTMLNDKLFASPPRERINPSRKSSTNTKTAQHMNISGYFELSQAETGQMDSQYDIREFTQRLGGPVATSTQLFHPHSLAADSASSENTPEPAVRSKFKVSPTMLVRLISDDDLMGQPADQLPGGFWDCIQTTVLLPQDLADVITSM